MAKKYYGIEYTKEDIRAIEIEYFKSYDVDDPNDELDTLEGEEIDEGILDFYEPERFKKLWEEAVNVKDGEFEKFILSH